MTGRRVCVSCGREVAARRVYVEVVGWARPRREGGTNAIALRRTTGRVMCADCVDEQRVGSPALPGVS